MMLSYLLDQDGSEQLIVCLEVDDLKHLARDNAIELPLGDLKHAGHAEEVAHLARTTIVLLPPGSTEYLLHAAVEARDSGTDVRIERRPHPGAP